MLLSAKHRFIFIHVYKVAGESVKAALHPYMAPSLVDRALARVNVTTETMRIYRMAGRFRKHASAKDAQAALPPEIYDAYFKFAFVRNPWDWQVSLYSYMLRDKFHKQHELITTMASFDAYIEWRVNEDKQFQKDFVTDGTGNLIVDFVGRYERLAKDFEEICQRLKIRAELPHKNRSVDRRPYHSYYNASTWRLVEEHFAEDIDFFGYAGMKWNNSQNSGAL